MTSLTTLSTLKTALTTAADALRDESETVDAIRNLMDKIECCGICDHYSDGRCHNDNRDDAVVIDGQTIDLKLIEQPDTETCLKFA